MSMTFQGPSESDDYSFIFRLFLPPKILPHAAPTTLNDFLLIFGIYLNFLEHARAP